MRVLVTGGAGFIGSHLIEQILLTTPWNVVSLDRIDETSAMARVDTPGFRQHKDRVKFIWHDLKAPINWGLVQWLGDFDIVFHLAASTHVDRSIIDPAAFVMDNVVGTCHLLQYAAKHAKLFVYQATDEVFGPADWNQAFTEDSPYNSSNAYSASKAGGAELTVAFANTHKLKSVIAYPMNCIGPRQHPEKFLPKVIKNLIQGNKISIHADANKTRAGARNYIHVENVCQALIFIAKHAMANELMLTRVNIGGERELSNLEMAQRIATIAQKPLEYELVDFHADRPGHDLRYALDSTRLKTMGYVHPDTFDENLSKTVQWYLSNLKWLGL